MSIKRAAAIPLMRRAIDKGQSRVSFLRELRTKGLTYRKTTMLGDWRTYAEIETKRDLYKYVRKDRLPSERVMAKVSWELPKEYMYYVKTRRQIAPEEPIIEQVKAVHYDLPLTPIEVEELAWKEIREQSPKLIEQVVSITAWEMYKRVL